MTWDIPPMWQGMTVAVLASGPSMSQSVADSVRHLPRIVVNSTYRLARDADMLYAADAPWWMANPEALDFPGLKVSIERRPGRAPGVPVLIVRNTGRSGFDPKGGIRTHLNSGAQAIQVAVHAKAARVLLFGFDMRGCHWHGAHPAPLKSMTRDDMLLAVNSMRSLAAGIKGCDVINCTPDSALDCFPRGSL